MLLRNVHVCLHAVLFTMLVPLHAFVICGSRSARLLSASRALFNHQTRIHSKTTWIGDFGLEIPDELLHIRHRSRVLWDEHKPLIQIKVLRKTTSSNEKYFTPISSQFSISGHKIPSQHVGCINIVHLDQEKEHREKHLVTSTTTSSTTNRRFIPWKQIDMAKEEEAVKNLNEADQKRQLLLKVDRDMKVSLHELIESGVLGLIIMLLHHYQHVRDVANIFLNLQGSLSAEAFAVLSPNSDATIRSDDRLVDWITECRTVLFPVSLSLCQRSRLLHSRVGAYIGSRNRDGSDAQNVLQQMENLHMSPYCSSSQPQFSLLRNLINSSYPHVHSLMEANLGNNDEALKEAYKNVDKDLMWKQRKRYEHENRIGKRTNVDADTHQQFKRANGDVASWKQEAPVIPTISLIGDLFVLNSEESFVCDIYKLAGV